MRTIALIVCTLFCLSVSAHTKNETPQEKKKKECHYSLYRIASMADGLGILAKNLKNWTDFSTKVTYVEGTLDEIDSILDLLSRSSIEYCGMVKDKDTKYYMQEVDLRIQKHKSVLSYLRGKL